MAGTIYDGFIGGGSGSSDILDGFKWAGSIGDKVGVQLMGRAGKDPSTSMLFGQGEAAIRDSLTRTSATARQRLGDSAAAGGFLDSGAIDMGNADINRSELDATGSAMRELFMGIYESDMQNIFGYLGLNNQAQSANLQAMVQERGQNNDLLQSFMLGI